MQNPHSPARQSPPTDIAAKLEHLAQLSSDDLRTQWRRHYHCEPAPRISKDLMIRAIAYKMQEHLLGGLKGPLKRKLNSLMETSATRNKTGIAKSVLLRPGMRLIRDWHGRQYDVLVIENGFEFQDRTYPSLTAIAKEITGAHWSGPRFFGLNKPPPKIMNHNPPQSSGLAS